MVRAWLFVLVGLSVLLSGCGESAGSSDDASPGSPLPTGRLSIDGETPVWVDGHTAHVGDTTFDLEKPPDVVAAGATGLYFLRDAVLYFADDTGTVKVGTTHSSELSMSLDRRYLGYVDFGPRFGERVAEAVVIDTTTGEQIIRTSVGNRTDADHLGDLYAESPPTPGGFEDDAFLMATARDGYYRIPLDGSDPQSLGDGWPDGFGTTAGGRQVWLDHDGSRWSIIDAASLGMHGGGGLSGSYYPGGPYASTSTEGPTRFFDVETGREFGVRSSFKHVLIGLWTGSTSFIGLGYQDATFVAPQGRSAPIACSLETRACRAIGPTRDVMKRGGVLFADGAPNLV